LQRLRGLPAGRLLARATALASLAAAVAAVRGGGSGPNTTQIYTHVCIVGISNIHSPFVNL
jgi:hypothetical protein